MCKKIIVILLSMTVCFAPIASEAASKTKTPAKSNVKIIARYGMKGDDVKKVQEQLIKAGFLQGRADGVFGNATYQAVKGFQETTKLKSDGIVGEQTLSALKKYKPPKKKAPPKPKQTKAKPTAKPAKNQPKKPAQQNKSPQLPTSKANSQVREAGIPRDWRPIQLEATAYTRYDEGCTDYTYRGTYLRRGLVAVDPDIIPLGTKLYIPDYGYAVADDIGGAIQGYKIDLAMETLDEAFAYGRRHITAYIVG